MKTLNWTRTGLLLAVCLAGVGLALTACGGGGGGDKGAGGTFVADLPENPEPGGEAPAPPGVPPAAPQPGDPGDPGAEPPAESPGEPVPGEPPAEPILPVEPEPLPAWGGIPDVKAVAVNPTDGTLWGIASTNGDVWRRLPGALAPEVVASLEIEGVRALAFAPVTSMLYAVVDDDPNPDDRLLRIDPDSFDVTPLGAITGYGHVEGLAYHTAHDKLFAVDTEADVLLELDTVSGTPTLIGELGEFSDLAGLAPDPEQPRLFATDVGAEMLVAVDLETGATSRLAATAGRRIEGLGFDAIAKRFYAATADPAEIYAYDPMGAWMDYADIAGLAYDPELQRFFGVYSPNGLIILIDADTAWKQVVGYVPVPGLEGLAYDIGNQTLYAVAIADQKLYALSPDDASIREVVDLNGPSAPFTGLAGLAIGEGQLYATDRDNGNLLRIEPSTGHTIALTNLAAWPVIEGLAYDAATGLLHAFSNTAGTHLQINLAKALTPVIVSQGELQGVRGLAWLPAERRLYGSDPAANTLALVYAPEPSALGYEDIGALAYREDTGQLIGFDLPTATFVEIAPALQLGLPYMTWAGIAVDGMTFDPEAQVVLAVDGASGNLYAIDAAWQTSPVGAEGVLAGLDVRALAYDPATRILWGVANATDRLLSIDRDTGEATVVDTEGLGLGYASVEAMVFDPLTHTLYGVDRATRTLLEIDRATGAALPIATLEAAKVSGMAISPAASVFWLANGDQIVAVDRLTGVVASPAPTLARHVDEGKAPVVRLLWPRGEVGLAALTTCGIEVRTDREGALSMEFRCGDQVLHRTTFEADHLLAQAEIPAAVREAIAEGEKVTWRVGDESAEFEVVDAQKAHEAIATMLGHPTMQKRSDWERGLVEAFLLDRYRLHTEALKIGLATFETYPDRAASARSVLRTLTSLDLLDSSLGAEARDALRRDGS